VHPLRAIRSAYPPAAINKNAKAPNSPDYGIVGDYADVVAALHRHLSAARTSHR
jgi:electron transfer flavoprotein alpha subunit